MNASTNLPNHPQSKTAIFIQDACYQHRFIRSRDTSNIVERPERLRAVKIGLSAALSRLQEVFLPVEASTAFTDATGHSERSPSDPDDLAAALGELKIDPNGSGSGVGVFPQGFPVVIRHSSASVDILNNEAVRFVHGDIEGDVYLMNLKKWVEESVDKINKGDSEIPEGYSQGDLYLCPESLNAIQGALGTVCEAVDTVMDQSTGSSSSNVRRAFVAIRPPGHHCGEDTPSGFCFVNNVAVAAAHAHLKHGINRIVILDIDLHHGNGTQSIVWQINEETCRQTLEYEAGAPTTKPGLKVYYGSLHDILSYPCEDGKQELVQAASVSIHGAHGQYIENVHLETYDSEEHFWEELYEKKYLRVLRKAEEFLEGTGSGGEDALVFVSCGLDASEHEYSSMSRHNRKVPTGFYHRFARDVGEFAERYARGRVISVLEGGYSDRALMSGVLAHFCGLVTRQGGEEGRKKWEWWSEENLDKLEKLTKKRRGGRSSLGSAASLSSTATAAASSSNDPWLEKTQTIFSTILEPNPPPPTSSLLSAAGRRRSVLLGPSSMTLRERKPRSGTGTGTPEKEKEPRETGTGSTDGSGKVQVKKPCARVRVSERNGRKGRVSAAGGGGGNGKVSGGNKTAEPESVSGVAPAVEREGGGEGGDGDTETESTLSSVSDDDSEEEEEEDRAEPVGLVGEVSESVSVAGRKLPRVILKLGPGPGPDTGSGSGST